VNREDLLHSFLEVTFPGRCLLCGDRLFFEGGSPLCEGCREGLKPLSGPRCRVCSMPLVSEKETCIRCRETTFTFGECFSLFAFEGKVRDLIHMYKFSGRTRLAGVFAGFLAGPAATRFGDVVVVPVPPRPERRGNDHVGRIARVLRTRHGLAVCSALEKRRGPAQKTLDFEQRRGNLVGAFRMKAGMNVPLNVLLLDDVFTTGATLDACARVLREGGVKQVSALTIAIDM
jgi:competence protein ComFC